MQFRIEYNRPFFTIVDSGKEYPTLIKVPGKQGSRPGKKVVLNRFDYVSLGEESDFYVLDFCFDEKDLQYSKVRPDALDLKWQDPLARSLDPKPRQKSSITLKFHDGALAGTKVKLEDKERYTIGSAASCDLVIPVNEEATNIASVHASITYERGFWYIEDHSTSSKHRGLSGTYIYPKNVLQMKNHEESTRIKIPWSPYAVNKKINNALTISVGGHTLLLSVEDTDV